MLKLTLPGLAAALLTGFLLTPLQTQADQPGPVVDEVVIGLTPVFVNGRSEFLQTWRKYLSARLGRPVKFAQIVH